MTIYAAGFNCAWQVMIVEKTGYTEFFAVDPQTRHRRKLHLEDLLTPRQKIMMDQDPYLIRDLARRLPTLLHQPQLEIHVDAFASLNGRPSQRIIQPGLNLMGALPNDWIMPLRACSAGEQLSLLSQRYPTPFQPGDPATSEAPMQSSADH